MKRSLLLFVVVFLTAFIEPAQSNQNREDIIDTDPSVYICISESSYAYHTYKTCWGYEKCKHLSKVVKRSVAIKKYKRVLCKICKKRTN